MRRTFGLLLLLVAVCPFCGGQTDDALTGTLFRKIQQFMTVWQKHDMASLGSMLAPEFLHVSSHGVGTRESVLRDLGGHCNLASYTLGEPRLLRTGADSAVMIYTIHQDLTCFGHPAAPDVQNTDTLVRRGGQWLFVLTTSADVVSH